MNASQVLVYRLYEQSELEERDQTLAQHLSAAGPGAPLEPWFESLPGGCFRWQDSGLLYGEQPGGTPPSNAADARRAAATYMKAVNDIAGRVRAARRLDRLRYPDPFPIEELQPLDVRPIRSRRTGRNEHWLTIWTMVLPTAPGPEGSRSAVLGGTVEVRVGNGGRVISVVSRARPWRTVSARPAWKHEESDHADAGAHTEAEPILIYLLDNPYEPQRFLAPCWLIEPQDQESHHARRLWPASDHSVLPEMVVEDDEGEATVTAQVLAEGRQVVAVENGDEWRLRWSVANLREYIAGERRVSTSSSVLLPGPGIYQVVLEVEHVATGAIRSTHSQIAIGRAKSEQRQRQPFVQS